MTDVRNPDSAERPGEPEFRVAQRARLVLEFDESDEHHHWAGDGWVRLSVGPWVHVWADEFGHWQTWPAHSVVCIDWGDGA